MLMGLFLSALFLIVLFALNFEFLLLPHPAVMGLGIAGLLLGAGIILIGFLRRRKGPPPPSETYSDVDKKRRSAGCLLGIVGTLYALTGIGIIVLQAVGYSAVR